MLVKTRTIAIRGIEPVGVDVEVSIYNRGLPTFNIVGLPDKVVDESRLRIISVFQNLKLEFPDKKITVNLAPADIKKDGTFYDLPIAVGIYSCINNITQSQDSLFFGELSLNGDIRYSKGAFLLGLYADQNGYSKVFAPKSSIDELGVFKNINVIALENIKELFDHFSRRTELQIVNFSGYRNKLTPKNKITTYNTIIGQHLAKRALQISLAGRHNLLMLGPPGSGKSLLAKSSIELLDDLSHEESIEVSKIYSSVGKLKKNSLISEIPFRSPHHTISYAGMIGGGSIPRPGEISFSHRGILFLDELMEFSKQVLETLRQPMEDGSIVITRARESYKFPCRFVLIGASNPCPCGFYGDVNARCNCSPKQIKKYFGKISGPIIDRFDLCVNVERVDESDLVKYQSKEFINNLEEALKAKNLIKQSVRIQQKRYESSEIKYNSEMNNDQISKFCEIDNDTRYFLTRSSRTLNLSARSFFKTLKVARTIADLAGKNRITIEDVAEALQYRIKLYDNIYNA